MNNALSEAFWQSGRALLFKETTDYAGDRDITFLNLRETEKGRAWANTVGSGGEVN